MARKKIWTAEGKTLTEVCLTATLTEDITILRTIAQTVGDARVLVHVAKNPHTTPDVLEYIYEFTDFALVLDALAINPRTPAMLLRTLAKRDSRTARGVAYNPSATPFILRMLHTHSNPYVRAGVAWNWNTPHDVQVVLGSDASEIVQAKLVKNTHLCVEAKLALAIGGLPETRLWLARGFYTEDVVFDVLVGDEDPAVRRAIAWNKYAPAHLNERLSYDPVEDVRRDVARQERTPTPSLKRLMLDPAPSVRWFAGKNPNAWD